MNTYGRKSTNKFINVQLDPMVIRPGKGRPRVPSYAKIEELARDGHYDGVWTAVLVAPKDRISQVANALKRAGLVPSQYSIKTRNAEGIQGLENEDPKHIVHFIRVDRDY